jgi:hypothetical protein
MSREQDTVARVMLGLPALEDGPRRQEGEGKFFTTQDNEGTCRFLKTAHQFPRPATLAHRSSVF